MNADAGYQLLENLLARLEPAARLVPGRLVRRLLVRLRDLDGFVLLVPHGWGVAVRSREALQHATGQELLLHAPGPIPEWLLLIARPSARTISGWDEATLHQWLKARLVHLAADRAFAQNRPAETEPWLEPRDFLDERVREEVVGVLAEEKRLVPEATEWEEREEFLATALELSLVDPPALRLWFPSVDQAELSEWLGSLRFLDPARLLAKRLDECAPPAAGTVSVPMTSACSELAHGLVAKLPEKLASRMSAEDLAVALAPVFQQVESGGLRSARSFLADLRQAVKLAGTPLEKVDAFRWIFSLGKEPLRRELPYSV